MRTIKGYVDRIENNIIIIISETDNYEFTVNVDNYKGELREKDWVSISLNENDDILNIVKDKKVTKQRTETVRVLKNKLKRRE